MNSDNDQYVETPIPSDAALTKIAEVAAVLVNNKHLIDQLEQQLDAAKKQFVYLSEVEIPQLMHNIGMSEFRLVNGTKIQVKPVIFCRMLKHRADDTDEWLNTNGHQGLMKCKVEIEVGRFATQEKRRALLARIKEMGFAYVDSKTIHPQTLNRWAREMEENGETIPTELFEVFRTYKTNIEE
jgi:hypothetical protein